LVISSISGMAKKSMAPSALWVCGGMGWATPPGRVSAAGFSDRDWAAPYAHAGPGFQAGSMLAASPVTASKTMLPAVMVSGGDLIGFNYGAEPCHAFPPMRRILWGLRFMG